MDNGAQGFKPWAFMYEKGGTMRKFFITLLLVVAVCVFLCGCGAAEQQEDSVTIATSWHGDVETTMLAYVELFPEPEYDNHVNYMALMVKYAACGNMDALGSAVAARNAKIIGQNLENELLTVQGFLNNFEQYAGFSLETDYTAEMIACCVAGNIESGRRAENSRNLKLDAMGSNDARIAFDDLYLLSKVITQEAGCSWLPVDWKMAVGEVLLNRVDSTEFPGTIYECVYQEGQYSNVNSLEFQNMTPFEDCVEVAVRLMSGERVLNEPSAVFQSNDRQGSGICLELYDEKMGYTYICYSSHPELYD